MIGFIRKLLKDCRGNALAIACACMPLVIGAAGLATDTIEWTLWRRQLQRAADSAALAGVYDRAQAANGATTNTPTAVCNDLAVNLHTWMNLIGTSPCTGSVGSYSSIQYPSDTGFVTRQVQVTLRVQQRLPFSSFFMSTPPTIQAVATAGTVSYGGSACVEALETSASSTGITASGSAIVNMPSCIMYSNSPASNSAAAGGSSNVTALAIATVGGVQQSNNWTVQSYRPYSPALSDPFANVNPVASDMHCTNSALDDSTDFSSLPAGTNCFNSLSVGSNRTLNVPDNFGPIYVNAVNGNGNVNLQGTFNCNGCTIVMTNSSSTSNPSIGTISSNASATNNITAPQTGPFAGIAIYQDRRASDCNSCNKVNGGSNSTITGALYFPSQPLWYNGGNGTTATCTMIVARRVTFTGNNYFKGLDQCPGFGPGSTNSVQMVRLIA
jgi:Flp pilus assembly protein TadG